MIEELQKCFFSYAVAKELEKDLQKAIGITQTELMKILHYNPETGEFHWIKQIRGVQVYSIAGSMKKDGYNHIRIDGKLYYSHRLAFLYMTGNFPPEQVDHINHKRDDNRFINLRLVSNQDNGRNASMSVRNKSGFVGVSWAKHANKWRACINISGKQKHLGLFKDLTEAINARKKANSKYKFHKNHGEKHDT